MGQTKERGADHCTCKLHAQCEPGTKPQIKMLDHLWEKPIAQDSPHDAKDQTIRKDG